MFVALGGGVWPLTVIQPCLASYVAFGAYRDGSSRGVLVQIDRRHLLAVGTGIGGPLSRDGSPDEAQVCPRALERACTYETTGGQGRPRLHWVGNGALGQRWSGEHVTGVYN